MHQNIGASLSIKNNNHAFTSCCYSHQSVAVGAVIDIFGVLFIMTTMNCIKTDVVS